MQVVMQVKSIHSAILRPGELWILQYEIILYAFTIYVKQKSHF